MAWERPKPAPRNEAAEERLKMVNAIKRHLNVTDWAKINWGQFYEAQEALGYELNNEQKRMMGR